VITIMRGGAIEQLKTIYSRSVNCCVTSPPYFGLRDYGVDEQIGLEKTPDEYVAALVEVFREVKRVLRDDGTLWLNLGDSYTNNATPGGGDPTIGTRNTGASKYRPTIVQGIKPKNLLGIPWRVAFALQADGWYLRQDIIWHKPNPMPESVTDRCTKAHEYIFLLSKSAKYYYDAESIKEESVYQPDDEANQWNRDNGKMLEPHVPGKVAQHRTDRKRGYFDGKNTDTGKEAFRAIRGTRNKRSVWTVPTCAYSGSHFAVFPPDLIIPCIKAGCPENGIVIDPFCGSGTTLETSARLGRNSIGIELNPDYIKLIEQRCHEYLYGINLFEGSEPV